MYTTTYHIHYRIYDPVKHLRWTFFRKNRLRLLVVNYFQKKAPSDVCQGPPLISAVIHIHPPLVIHEVRMMLQSPVILHGDLKQGRYPA